MGENSDPRGHLNVFVPLSKIIKCHSLDFFFRIGMRVSVQISTFNNFHTTKLKFSSFDL